MDIRELQAFTLLADQLHFSRTAELLHVSQPALTKQIRRLEEELGAPLFVRAPQGNQLTRVGELFAAQARELVSAHERLEAYGSQLARGEAGSLRIGFGYHTLELVPRVVVGLREQFPRLEITLKDMSTVEQLAELRLNRLDVGFVRLPVSAELDSLPVREDELMLVSRKPVRSLKSCANVPFVLMSRERTPSLYAQCVRRCARAGFVPRVVQEVPEPTTVLALVRAGMGVSMMARTVVEAGFPGIHVRSLQDRWTVGAAWRQGDTNPALQSFLKLLKKASSTA